MTSDLLYMTSHPRFMTSHPLYLWHEFEEAPEVGDGQGSLVCCGPWGQKESDTNERLN